MSYRQTYNRITRGGNANTYQHLGNAGKPKSGQTFLHKLANSKFKPGINTGRAQVIGGKSERLHMHPGKFLAKLEKQHRKTGASGDVKRVKAKRAPAGVSGLARPLATPKATGRKAVAKPTAVKIKRPIPNRSKVSKLMAASNAAAASPTRPGIKGGLLRHARYAAAKLGRRISHVSRSFARHF